MTRDDIINIARDASAKHGHIIKVTNEVIEVLTSFAAIVSQIATEKERSACYLVCEDQAFRSMQKSHRAGTVGKAATHQARAHGAQFCAAAIRQRETKN